MLIPTPSSVTPSGRRVRSSEVQSIQQHVQLSVLPGMYERRMWSSSCRPAPGLQPKRVAVQKQLPWVKKNQGSRTPPLTRPKRMQGRALENQFYKYVAFYIGIDEHTIRAVYHGVLDVIATKLINDNKVMAPGLVSFKVQEQGPTDHGERRAFGKTIVVPAKNARPRTSASVHKNLADCIKKLWPMKDLVFL